jgi:RND family efflux transporter MFP subunit
MGYVRAVRVRAGDSVTTGQPLVELEANDVRASVARARAALDRSLETKSEAENGVVAARADAKMAKSFYDRALRLVKDSAISQQQFDDAEARWHAAAAQEQMANARVRAVGSGIDEARAALGEASATLGYAAITAPFSGRVIERRVDPGALAAPGTPLLVLSDESALRVEAAIEESLADQVKVGDEAEIRVGSAPSVVGKIGEIVPNVDVATRAFLVKIDLPSTLGSLRPGTFARVFVHAGARARLVVPTSAITSLGALDRVFVLDGSRAHLRMITRGEPVGPATEVLSGLSPGERVVTSPPPDLRDGMAIEVKP